MSNLAPLKKYGGNVVKGTNGKLQYVAEPMEANVRIAQANLCVMTIVCKQSILPWPKNGTPQKMVS